MEGCRSVEVKPGERRKHNSLMHRYELMARNGKKETASYVCIHGSGIDCCRQWLRMKLSIL